MTTKSSISVNPVRNPFPCRLGTPISNGVNPFTFRMMETSYLLKAGLVWNDKRMNHGGMHKYYGFSLPISTLLIIPLTLHFCKVFFYDFFNFFFTGCIRIVNNCCFSAFICVHQRFHNTTVIWGLDLLRPSDLVLSASRYAIRFTRYAIRIILSYLSQTNKMLISKKCWL